MVKGVAKRVIVVKSPDPKLFDEAIFIVRDDVLLSTEVDSEEVLRQAQMVAGSYLKSTTGRTRLKLARFPAPAFAAAGAAVTSIAWLALRLVGV